MTGKPEEQRSAGRGRKPIRWVGGDGGGDGSAGAEAAGPVGTEISRAFPFPEDSRLCWGDSASVMRTAFFEGDFGDGGVRTGIELSPLLAALSSSGSEADLTAWFRHRVTML